MAPVAKMEQQRTRRYKSSFESKLKKKLGNESVIGWNKTAITPVTEFMNNLDKYIHNHYRNSEKKIGVKKIIISTSTEVGEGEHKIFQFIHFCKEKQFSFVFFRDILKHYFFPPF